MEKFALEGEYIPLIGLLKATHMARSGGEAQRMVERGEVQVNGQAESRKRAKIRPGDRVRGAGREVLVVGPGPASP